MKRELTSAISQLFGKFASKEFSKPMQTFINSSYINMMGLDMSEFADASSYRSLNALFTRKLLKDREFSHSSSDFISPCDSLITECGDIKNDTALQIKGMSYSCYDFLGPLFSQEEKEIIKDGKFINFYLSPKDYHRYHIPTDLKVLKVAHIAGKFYPVNIASLKKRINLFIENERVVLLCESSSGKKFYMVLVSALNVGVMRVAFDGQIQTNADITKPTLYSYENLYLSKGEDFGCFEMGSTIVILAQKDMLDLKVKTNQKVKYAQSIATLL